MTMLMMQSSNAGLASASAPPKSLRKLFVPPPPEKCTRCGDRVYPVEKVGPVNEVIFHKQCFKCVVCGNHLTLKTYFTNQNDFNDREIYCTKHCPRSSTHGYDARAVGMRSVMSAPGKGRALNEQIRGTGDAPRIGSDAMHIRGPMSAQNHYQRKYITKYDKHNFPAYLVSKTKDKLFKYQEELERQQREEEDRLMAQFQEERVLEAEKMKKEFENEWEVQLKEITAIYEGNPKAAKKDKTIREMPLSSERYEEAKEELKKTMTLKMMKKKEQVTMKLQRKAQQETATLVTKHAQQMLELLQSKQEELQRELEEEIIQNAPEIENQEEFLQVAKAALMLPAELPEPHAPRGRKRDLYHDPSVFDELDNDVVLVAESEQATFTDLVKQLTENCLSDLQKARAIFRWITVKDLNVMEFDESVKQDTPLGLLRGIKYGTESYHTLFMRLCSYAGLPSQEVKGHAKSVGYEPGLKIPEDKFLNTWNVVLIMGDWWPVQCNWGARHLVLNKDAQDTSAKRQGKDKIRYQYDEHYFLTDPDEFIQEFCALEPEWQLLSQPITLEQFEALPFVRSIFFHYGLEFTEEIKSVINCDNKGGAEVKINVPEELGDDVIFHYQLFFAERERRNEVDFRGVKLERFVYHSLSDGCALFSVHVPSTGSYYLEIFANKIEAANKLSDDPNSTITPFRLKCACKFKLICDELIGKMHPLPNCATGEWGPAKARRHFDLVPLTHSSGVIAVNSEVEVRFRQPRSLIYVVKLRFNDGDDKQLQEFVNLTIEGDVLIIRVKLPQVGQYGLDVFAKPHESMNPSAKAVLAHVCKYLLNCTHVANPVELLPSPTSTNGVRSNGQVAAVAGGVAASPPLATAITLGPLPAFDELGLRALTHPEQQMIQKQDKSGGVVIIEFAHPDSLRLVSRLSSLPGGEEASNRVSEKSKGKKTLFKVTIPKDSGAYAFGIFAVRKDDTTASFVNVYNYMIDLSTKDKKK